MKNETLSHLYDYQKEAVKKAQQIFSQKSLVYLACEERTGKTFIALSLLTLNGFARPLVITKKAAISGWTDAIKQFYPHYLETAEIINFQSLHKITRSDFDCVIIDEAHANLGGYPRPSKTARLVQKMVYEKPIVFCSATPSAQTYASLFHQLNVSKFSPFSHYRNFYEWFKRYGIPQMIRGVGGRQIVKYDNIKYDEIAPLFEYYFVFLTRKDTQFFSVEPEDELVYVEPSDFTRKAIKTLKQRKCLELFGEKVVLDTISKEMHVLHEIEGGAIKVDDKNTWYLENDDAIGVNEKIAYIKRRWGDSADFVIFYEYIAEGDLLRRHFNNAVILQGTTFAEGVDLSHLSHAVVFSMNFSTAKYIQRRCRLCSPTRKTPIKVYYLIYKGLLSDKLYSVVADKRQNFTTKIYENFNFNFEINQSYNNLEI